jgi:hypothetical protein
MGHVASMVAASNYPDIHNNTALNISEIIYVGAFKAKIMIFAVKTVQCNECHGDD